MISRCSGHLTPPVTCIIGHSLRVCSKGMCAYVSISNGSENSFTTCARGVQEFIYLQAFVTALINIGDNYFRQEQNIAFLSATMSRVKFLYNVTSSSLSIKGTIFSLAIFGLGGRIEPLDGKRISTAYYF